METLGRYVSASVPPTSSTTKATIQVLTHCDPLRAVRACILASTAEVEVLCAVNGSLDEVRHRLGSIQIPKNLVFIPSQPKSPYPINRLRNNALEAASADWVFYIDCDFIFSENIWTRLLSQYDQSHDDLICLCPVALLDPNGHYLTQPRSPRILEEETPSTHTLPRVWSDATFTKLFDFHERYFKSRYGPAAVPYDMTSTMMRLRQHLPAEPWGLLKRAYMMYADEDFRAGPLDKQQLVGALLDRGVRFRAIPDAFVFHMWHPGRYGGESDRIRNYCLWAKRHRGRSHRYLLVGEESVVGNIHEMLFERMRSILGTVKRVQLSRWPENPLGAFSQFDSTKINSEDISVVIYGITHLHADLFPTGCKVCLFFRSPLWYRRNELLSMRSYAEALCGTPYLVDAIALLDNTAIVCDLDQPMLARRLLRNLTGFDLPIKEFENNIAFFPFDHHDESVDRASNPADYLLYDYVRGLAGTLEMPSMEN